MKLKEAFNRLRFTLSKQNKPNENDIEAFNKICEIFQMTEYETIQENLLFAKLYTFVLSEFCTYYTDLDFANKQINSILSEPLSVRIDFLQMKIQTMEYQNYFKQKGILDPFLKTKHSKEIEEIHERHKNNLPELNQAEFLKLGNKWDKETIIYNLESNINLSIQNFKNNV